MLYFFFFQAEDGIRDKLVTGVQTCALPISAVEIGAERAVAVLGTEPEQFGPLKTVDRRRALGLGVARDAGPARLAAPSAAVRARDLAEAHDALGLAARGHGDQADTRQEATGRETERSAEAPRREAERLVTRAAERLR